MTEPFRIALIGIVVLLAQIGTGPLLELFRIRPDLTLIYTLLITLRHGKNTGLLTGFALGLMLDFLSIGSLGVNALAKSTLAFWIGFWLDNRVGSVAIGWWIFVLAVSSIVQGSIIGLLSPMSSDIEFSAYFFRYVLPGTLYTSVVGLLWAMAPMGTRSRGPLAPAITRGRRTIR